MKNRRLPLLTAALVLVAAPLLAQIDTSTDEGQISQLLRDLRIAHASADVEGVMRAYWNDPRLTVIDPDDAVRLVGHAAYKLWLQDHQSVGQRNLFWRAHERKVHVRGDNAFVTFLVTRQVQMGSTVRQKHERGTYVLKKMDGKWLIVAQHISALPPMLNFQQTK